MVRIAAPPFAWNEVKYKGLVYEAPTSSCTRGLNSSV